MLCSGINNQKAQVQIKITKTFHHLEPGMEPASSYEISHSYIGPNSIGLWDRAGSTVMGSIILSEEEMSLALKQEEAMFVVERTQANVNHSFSLSIHLESNKALIAHTSGKSISYGMTLVCAGKLAL